MTRTERIERRIARLAREIYLYGYRAHLNDYNAGIGAPRSELALRILACADAAKLVWR
ncbi:hypothetical protein [Bradyrhizobium sp. SZCCHNRI2010]|uniref:hypothetical protein n=1 Tax=Bradyrhizobium sp. SZCCHNRI2010 TaxID=3057283 RepID=UPI0028E7260A|nr:hypothetical protein [Bradyrhizobium sp. SZCCHNRI2010]